MKITKETLRRAGRTFLQTAISYVAANLCLVDFTQSKDIIVSALLGLVISALSAGLAAIMNLQKNEQQEITESEVE